MTCLRSSPIRSAQCSAACVVFGILLLASIIVMNSSSVPAADAACAAEDRKPRRDLRQIVENQEECCTCSRELWRILFGGVTTLASLLVSLGGWYHSDFHKDKRKICGYSVSPFRAFITVVAGSLVPQIFMSFVLSSTLAAVLLQQRIAMAGSGTKTEDKHQRVKEKGKGGIWGRIWQLMCAEGNGKTEEEGKRQLAKRICTMVVWVRIEEGTYDTLVRGSRSLLGLFGTHLKKSGIDKESSEEPAPGIEDALFFKEGKSLRASPAVLHSTGSTAEVKHVLRPASSSTAYYYLCSHSWDNNNLLWKEALLQTEGVLPEVEELQIIQTRTTWECAIVAMQSLGYLVSILSRFAYGRDARVSAVEVMSAWICVALLVQVLIIPTVATYCNRGICLDLSEGKLREVVEYYERKRERQEMLSGQAVTVLVLCLIFVFALFLILIPPLVYYYYRLNNSVLSFVALLPFTLLSGIAIVAFVLTLIFPPQDVIFGFVAFPFLKPPRPLAPESSRFLPIISVPILLLGVCCYVLAVIDTTLNWHLFRARDCYLASFIIPHIGS